LASALAAWITETNPLDLLRGSALANTSAAISFNDRFGARSTLDSAFIYYPSRPVLRGSRTDFNAEFAHIQGSLTEQLRDTQTDEPPQSGSHSPTPPPTGAAIPMPRSRPVEANLQVNDPSTASVPVAQTEERSIWQKITDWVPGRVQLASLEPNGGILPGTGPSLTTLGYDSTTAVYDITARTVYMPDGTKLEAHSGLGNLMDDPSRVNARNAGATPPGIYEMKPREKLFHGVPALRMNPVDGTDTFGRAGLLAHPYMLGPNGDSNGCVSIKNYDHFLKAYRNGEIKRIAVVVRLNDRPPQTAVTRSASQS
jgi:type VI secretion system (T6SS) effector TldE1-like protein